MSRPHKAEIKLLRQSHDPRLREVFSGLPDHLKHTTGGLMGIDDDQGRLRS
jgi:hypothetical protein